MVEHGQGTHGGAWAREGRLRILVWPPLPSLKRFLEELRLHKLHIQAALAPKFQALSGKFTPTEVTLTDTRTHASYQVHAHPLSTQQWGQDARKT